MSKANKAQVEQILKIAADDPGHWRDALSSSTTSRSRALPSNTTATAVARTRLRRLRRNMALLD
ncbi:MAG: hypothetical protein SPL67_05390 [Prevotella sp.]|nr:hypothetical protein [Prevotella sp.]